MNSVYWTNTWTDINSQVCRITFWRIVLVWRSSPGCQRELGNMEINSGSPRQSVYFLAAKAPWHAKVAAHNPWISIIPWQFQPPEKEVNQKYGKGFPPHTCKPFLSVSNSTLYHAYDECQFSPKSLKNKGITMVLKPPSKEAGYWQAEPWLLYKQPPAIQPDRCD